MPEPTFGEPQLIVAILFAALALVVTGVFTLVAVRSRRELPYDVVKVAGYRLRPWWLAALGTVLTAGVVASLFLLPYSHARGAGSAVQDIRVSGGQFYWSLSPKSVTTGVVRFHVSAADVNHALGIYGPKGQLLGSVQAMPGYTNVLDVRLDDPGSYTLSCLELCGMGHHRMHVTLAVAPGRS